MTCQALRVVCHDVGLAFTCAGEEDDGQGGGEEEAAVERHRALFDRAGQCV
jgi:hypothetical protein